MTGRTAIFTLIVVAIVIVLLAFLMPGANEPGGGQPSPSAIDQSE